jgi:PHD/YefM family antitoxin component YafN of YafNO toxin-antitoxin module
VSEFNEEMQLAQNDAHTIIDSDNSFLLISTTEAATAVCAYASEFEQLSMVIEYLNGNENIKNAVKQYYQKELVHG